MYQAIRLVAVTALSMAALTIQHASAQYRASVGCSADKIDSLNTAASLEDLECKCFNKCPSSTTSSPTTTRKFRTYEGRDIDGTDYKIIKGVNFEACISQCKSEDECVAYSFDKWNRYCFLKNRVPSILRIEPNSIVGVVTGTSPAVSSSSVVMERFGNKAFPDAGYRQVAVASYNGCSATCMNEDKCEVFTFRKSDKVCNLIARPGEWWPDSSADSGVKRQIP
ncbi:PAN domain-containing protein [Bradyrhizobium japonicum]|uniref:PAN domain-containing protein n=1 Tax=Bradyrhizobium japonicum TaxID=375 RepID=UPI003B682238